MKSKLRVVLIAGVSVVSVLLSSCCSTMAPPKESILKKYDISVQVKGSANQKKLDIDADTKSKCKKPPHQPNDKFGCIDVGLDEQAEVSFKLIQNSWHMTEIRICDGASKDIPSCSLSPAGQKEFAVVVAGDPTEYEPGQEGRINLLALFGKISLFSLKDRNNIHLPKEYFYILRACKNTDASNCADSDPVIKNGGRQKLD